MENDGNLRALFQKYLDGQCTDEEIAFLFEYFHSGRPEESLRTLIQEELQNNSDPDPEIMASVQAYTERVGKYLKQEIKHLAETKAPLPRFRRLPGKWMPAAAAVLILMVSGIGWWYWQASEKPVRTELHSSYGDDMLPGGNRATLTLSDGRVIDLDSAAKGLLVRQAGISITKNEEGTLAYELAEGAPAEEIVYNTVSTPKGGQYQVILPDGSKVWLNAASSLKYPTRFTGKERLVELAGEGYFEVTRRPGQVFTVKSREQSVRVLGTEFNINAYDNELTVNTTLVNGRVHIRQTGSGRTLVLAPGQQTRLAPDLFRLLNVDTKEYVGWKNGDFIFNNTPLDNILRQLERWYDIEVDYRNIPGRKLSGAISRGKKLSSVLYMIEKSTGLVFTLKERRLSLPL